MLNNPQAFYRQAQSPYSINTDQNSAQERRAYVTGIFPGDGPERDRWRSGPGGRISWEVVKIPRHLAQRALSSIPRTFCLGARRPEFDLNLAEDATYFTTDGCGIETIDFDTRQRRRSCKEDVGKMARIADSLSSIGFYWPMVSD